MMARRKVEQIDDVELPQLRKRVIDALPNRSSREAAEKDLLLIEAALATDSIVSSLDERVHQIFQQAGEHVGELRLLLWCNPTVDPPATIEWLATGAKKKRSYMLVPGEPGKFIDVVRRDLDALGDLLDAGVARCAKDLLNLGALPDLPGKGVLPAPASYQQYFHCLSSPCSQITTPGIDRKPGTAPYTETLMNPSGVSSSPL